MQANLVKAGMLGQVLSQCGVPMAVLNACQSATVDKRAENAYASVAASLLGAGIRSVAAMGYSLWVSGAKEFVPAFYEQLFRDGTPAGAMRAGRMAMFIHSERDSVTGKTPLQDWVVPQLYQKIPAGARVLPKTKLSDYEPEMGMIEPPDALEQDIGGFIGRGQAVLELERILQRKTAAGILIHGMAGAGKTTLAKGFLAWLRDTGGLREENGTFCPVIWFDFRDVYSGTYIVDQLAARLCEGGASAKNEENLRRVVSHLKRRRAFIVWDNFESATGAPGTNANLPDKERQYLKGFLEKLRGGRSKVLITSRTGENWLPDHVCARIRRDLDGLRGEELWAYCGQIAEELDITIDPEDADLLALLDKLDGNPLAVRSVLLRLKDTNAAELSRQLDRAFRGAAGDESTKRIQAAFEVLTHGADADMTPVLQALGLHEHYANADDIENICALANDVNLNTPERDKLSATVTRCFTLLESAGMCTHTGNNIYRMHPALRGCLAEKYAAPEDVCRWFARCMTYVENQYQSNEEKRRAFFFIHEANIRHAQEIAEALDLREEDLRLTLSLAANADDRGNYAQSETLLLRLADKARQYGSPEEEDRAYNLLSKLAFKRGDKEAEKKWAQKAADVWKNAENLNADILYTMGNNAYSQGDYATAMKYWEQAAIQWEREDNSNAIALYGELGNLALLLNDYTAAQKWLLKFWEAAKERKDVANMAVASISLAVLAKDKGDFQEAERWYRQSIALFQRLGDNQMISVSRQMLGDLYVKMGRAGDARKELTEAVNIAKRLNLKPQIADCYDSLGDAALLEGGFTEARDCWEEALKLYEELKDEKNAARVRAKMQRLEEMLNGKQ